MNKFHPPVQSIHRQYFQEKGKLQVSVMQEYAAKFTKFGGDDNIPAVGWAVLMAGTIGQRHYHWLYNTSDCQLRTSCYVILVKILDTDCPYFDLQGTAILHLQGAQYSWRYITERRKVNDEKPDSNTIISRSAHFIDQFQRSVDEHLHRRKEMCTRNTSDEFRIV